jgi:hypothetical protein
MTQVLSVCNLTNRGPLVGWRAMPRALHETGGNEWFFGPDISPLSVGAATSRCVLNRGLASRYWVGILSFLAPCAARPLGSLTRINPQLGGWYRTIEL